MIKPQIHIVITEYVDYLGRTLQRNKVVQFKTHRDLKKNLKKWIGISSDDEAYVYRSRRGEWGEWFEVWTISNNKLKLLKQGWQ